MKRRMIYNENKSMDIDSKISCSVLVNVKSFYLKTIYVKVYLVMSALCKI